MAVRSRSTEEIDQRIDVDRLHQIIEVMAEKSLEYSCRFTSARIQYNRHLLADRMNLSFATDYSVRSDSLSAEPPLDHDDPRAFHRIREAQLVFEVGEVVFTTKGTDGLARSA